MQSNNCQQEHVVVQIEMTADEKRHLIRSMKKLSRHQIGPILEIITAGEQWPKNPSTKKDDVEINLDSLKTTTLRSLEDYVNSILDTK